jgi:type I restriction enzyme M protein
MPYVAHALRSLKLNRLARGTAQPSISYASIKDVKLALPEYKKQIEMSAVFDEIQSKNTELQVSLKLQIEKLNELTNYSININCI